MFLTSPPVNRPLSTGSLTNSQLLRLRNKGASPPIDKKTNERLQEIFNWVNHKTPSPLHSPAIERKNRTIIPLGDAKGVRAYYKKGEEPAQIEFEKLIFDIAQLAGLHNQFAPTVLAEITQEHLLDWKEGAETAEDRQQEKLQRQKSKGIIQEAIQGTSLEDLLDEDQERVISQKHLLKAALTSLFIGSYDLHGGNLYYVFGTFQNKGFKFFDNTRSLPHSNGVINWGGYLLPSFRSGLLDCQKSYLPLSADQKEWLRLKTHLLQEKAAWVEDFLNQARTQKRISKLPKHWFDSQLAMRALKERLENISRHLHRIQSIRDLCFVAIPDLKWLAALHLLSYQEKDIPKAFIYGSSKEKLQEHLQHFQCHIFSEIGAITIEELLDRSLEFNIDVLKIYSNFQSEELLGEAFDAALLKALEELRDSFPLVKSQASMQHLGKQRHQLYTLLKNRAAYDYKDLKREIIDNLPEAQLKKAPS
ncbi:MAG: hypothetical protein K0S07_358 [Chlamydiales bacterium]|nr:hypothetical protein [Chlamydiales bacterium]